MRLPLIKNIIKYQQERNLDDINSTIAVLEHVSQGRGIKPEELDVVGELLSNLYGAIEVSKMIDEGQTETEALNTFMSRVVSSVKGP